MTTQAPETKIVDSYRVACDGGEGGHPRVWLQIPGEHGWVECPYCDCKYVHKDFEGKVLALQIIAGLRSPTGGLFLCAPQREARMINFYGLLLAEDFAL